MCTYILDCCASPESREVRIPIPERSSQTVQKAKGLFAHLREDLDKLPNCKMLPQDKVWPEGGSLRIEPIGVHWSEVADPYQERCRVETPSLNAVLRLCYLTTFLDENQEKVPFAEEDLAAFVESKITRNRTYFWFKWGMGAFALCALVGAFANCIAPSTHARDRGAYLQGVMIFVATLIIAGLGVIFTGVNPDLSQDRLNDKVDKLNRVKEKLDEVARTLIIFCYYKKREVRQLAQIAAQEISIPRIAGAARPQKYALQPNDVAHALILLKQAVDYIQEKCIPENHELNKLVQDTLKRKEELMARNEWE